MSAYIVSFRQALISSLIYFFIILVDVCEQLKQLVREKLAPCLRVRIPASKTSKPSVVYTKKDGNDAGDFYYDGQQLQDNVMTTGTTNDKLLMEIRAIRQLLQTKIILSKAEDSDKPDDEAEEIKNDWKLAAAFFDRILLIIFSILLVGGSIIFFITFAVIHTSQSKWLTCNILTVHLSTALFFYIFHPLPLIVLLESPVSHLLLLVC